MDGNSGLSPTVVEAEVIAAIEKHLHTENVNWGELNTINDLYSVCDSVSALFNGLPDSILKSAMHNVIEKNIQEAETCWIKDHLMQISTMWIREAKCDKPFMRNTRVIMKAPLYEPYTPQKCRKRKKDHYKNGRTMLSVSSLLQSTKFAMNTPNGNVAVEEDENGNITLNGEELTFDSWSRVTKTDDPVVASCARNRATPIQWLRKDLRVHNDYKSYRKKQDRKLSDANRIDNHDSQEAAISEAVHGGCSSIVTQPKELDEGEIDSEEERQMDERENRRKSYSSTSEDSDGGVVNARRRRSLLRKNRKSGDSNLFNSEALSQFFHLRHQLIMMLPLNQKQEFMTLLKTNKATSR